MTVEGYGRLRKKVTESLCFFLFLSVISSRWEGYGRLREKGTGGYGRCGRRLREVFVFCFFSQFLLLGGKVTGGYGRRLREVTGEGYGRLREKVTGGYGRRLREKVTGGYGRRLLLSRHSVRTS